MEPDELGQTSICDVSEKDAQVLRQLNLLEVTSLFDEHNISWTRLRGRRKYKGKTRNPALAIKELFLNMTQCLYCSFRSRRVRRASANIVRSGHQEAPLHQSPFVFRPGNEFKALLFTLFDVMQRFLQLCDHLEKCAIEEEGILRVPGSAARIKVRVTLFHLSHSKLLINLRIHVFMLYNA